ncbi:MAG: enoyl-CoA hydratase [Actinomycetia bacterium]|nr:enoyl-CoA hydratase [Actinomycetes bacterium]
MGALRVNVSAAIAWVTLDRPDEGNPIDAMLIDALSDTWQRLALDDTVKAVGLAASGPAFSVGVPAGCPPPNRAFGPKSCGYHAPVLVELEADIASGAFPLIGEADVVLATPDVQFTAPIDAAARVDVARLRPRLAEPQLRRLALLGAAEPLTARRAEQLGVIDALVPAGELRQRSLAILSVITHRALYG